MTTRSKLHTQIDRLNESLIDICNTVKEAIELATAAFINKDIELAHQVLEIEREINQKEKDIESLCFKLLLQQQPVARDFRFISATLKMITDMERIGDQASDIAEICIELANEPYIKPNLDQVSQMAEAAIKMVQDSISAVINHDKTLARAVIKYDQVVDDLFESMKDELFALILADVQNGRQALDLLMIAKYYERIGDHAVNIAEWALYSITGTKKPEKKKKPAPVGNGEVK
ncbi:MAG: phosphate signaling complex protein PhoU [Clostridiales bacterium]|jgi:phosphate transport system protein|nr:phosphate signaling complex protein PhoU [Clostridiales bacterium]